MISFELWHRFLFLYEKYKIANSSAFSFWLDRTFRWQIKFKTRYRFSRRLSHLKKKRLANCFSSTTWKIKVRKRDNVVETRWQWRRLVLSTLPSAHVLDRTLNVSSDVIFTIIIAFSCFPRIYRMKEQGRKIWESSSYYCPMCTQCVFIHTYMFV